MGPSIFEIINRNIIELSEDLLILHRKVDEMHKVLYPPQEMPNATGETHVEKDEVSSEND